MQKIAVFVAVFMQMCLVGSGLSAGDFADTFGSLPNFNWRDIPPKAKLITVSVQMQDGGLLIPGAGDAARITSVDKFRTGQYSVRFRLRGLGAGNNAYLGFMSREPWGENACLVVLENDRFGMQIRRAGGEVAQPFATPIVTSGAWHTLTLDWTADAVEMVYDGQSCGRFTDKTKIPDLFMPSLIDVVQAGGKGFELEVDSVHVKNGEVRRGARQSGLQPPLRTPPDTQTLAWPERTNPELRMEKTGATFANAFYSASVSWEKGLRIDCLDNKTAKLSCLIPNQSMDFFSIATDGKILRSSDFKVIETKPKENTKEKQLEIRAEADGWRVFLSVSADSSPEMRLNLAVENTDVKERKAAVYWPYFSSLQIGENATDNYYIFPWKGGWCQNRPTMLGATYGQSSGFMQLFTLFNPGAGVSVYTYTRDESGRIKTALLKKVESLDTEVLAYVPLWPETKPEKGVMADALGAQIAMRHLPYVFKTGKPQEFPEVVLAISPGDWHQALRSYADWAHTWMKAPEIPKWYKSIFQTLAVHDQLGNKGFEKGWLLNGQWAMAEQAKPDQQLLEVNHWWNHAHSNGVEAFRPGLGWNKFTYDWKYWDEVGGLARLRQEIEGCHQKGVRVNLYTTPRFAWEFSDVRKAHPEWLLFNPDGSISRDWSADVDNIHINVDDMCYSFEEWLDYAANAAAKVVRDTGCDGVFIDTANEAKFCYNPAHHHSESESPSFWAETMLKKHRKAIKAANPQAVMTAEDFCAERFIQFIDGCLIKTFDSTQAIFTEHDLYALHFARFYFPEVHYQEWGSIFEHGARRAFFNGVCYMRGDIKKEAKDPFTDKVITPQEQLAYLDKVTGIMRENVDAFAGLHPEPLVPTKVSKVYANKFPGKDQIVWTIYNRSGKNLDGELIEVTHVDGARYVNLMTGNEITPSVKDGKATLHLVMENGEVTAVAQRESSWKKAEK